MNANTSTARIEGAFGLSPTAARLLTIAGLTGVVLVAALSTYLQVVQIVVVLALGGLATIVGLRWPLFPLLAFAALIPIEQLVVVEGFGTISRLAGLLFVVCYGVPRLGQLALGAMPPAAWAYLAWAVLSLGWAIDPGTAVQPLSTLVQLFVIAVLIADFVVRHPTILRPVLWVYSLSAAITALIGILSYLGQGVATTRAVALQGQDPAQFAAALLPAVFFGLDEFLHGDKRIAGAAVFALATAGVVVSGTRGSWVAGAIVVVFLVLPRLTARGRAATVAMILGLLVLAYQIPGVADMFEERTGSALATGGAGRTDIWTVGGTIYESSPVLGVGYANFPIAYTDDVVRAAGVSYTLSVARAPHNLAIGTLVELGPLGLLLLVAFLGPLVVRRRVDAYDTRIQAMLLSLLAAAVFVDIFGNRKEVWLLIGLASGTAYIARQAGKTTSVEGPMRVSDPDAIL